MNNENISLMAQWQNVCRKIMAVSSDTVLNGWLSQITPQMTSQGEIYLSVPTRFMHEWIKTKSYDTLICSLWQDENPNLEKVLIRTQTPIPEPVCSADEKADTFKSTVNLEETPAVSYDLSETGLDPDFTFDNYIVGKSNEFAVAAAKRVSGMLDANLNPLYVYSSVGQGKTHLMHAIAWDIKKNFPQKKVLYVSAEKFMYQFVQSLKKDDTISFRELFRNVDVLIIDDVQFICGKKGTQEEFFHTFNALIEQGKHIIMCSDTTPLELQGLEDRLKSRIAHGLVVDIHPTTYEMRLGILEVKAQQMGVQVPFDVIEFLSEKITTNVRELEGALRKVVAAAQLLGTPITLSTTQMILRDLMESYQKEVSISEIQKQTADYFNINLSDLKSVRRDRKIARPRQIAMYLAKTMTTKSLPDIGLGFGRDHTTVMHAVKTIEAQIKKDSELSDHIMRLKQRIKG